MRRRLREDDLELDVPRDTKPRRRRRKPAVRRFTLRRLVLIVGLLVVITAGLLPRIASLGFVRPLWLGVISSKTGGEIEIGEMSMGWLAPIRIGNLRIYDASGNLTASIGALRTEKSLSALAWNTNDLGRIDIEKPAVSLIVRSGGSNLEDLVAKLMPSESSGSGSIPRASIHWSEGSLAVAGENNVPSAQFTAVQGEAHLGFPGALLAMNAGLVGTGRTGASGSIQVQLTVGSAEAMDFDNGQVQIHAQDVPLDATGQALARIGLRVDCQGQLSGDSTLSWSKAGDEIAVDLDGVRLSQLALVAPSWLGNDRLVVQEGFASGQLKLCDAKLAADRFHLQTEFASIDALGEIDLKSVAQALGGGQLPQTDFQFGGNVDVARLTQMLPETMRLQPGVQIQKADLSFQSFSRLEGGRRRLLVDGEAKDFAGLRDGQAIRWTKPIRLSTVLTQDGQHASLESIQFETNSISINGQSDIQSGRLKAAGDLGGLQTELEQFFALQGFNLSGQFDGELRWDAKQAAVATESWPLQVDGECQFESLIIALPGFDRFAEPAAHLQFAASGQAARAGGIRIESARMEFVAGDDGCEGQLLQPIENPSWESTIEAQCAARGSLASWLRRLGPFLPKYSFSADGTVSLRGNASIHRSSVRLQAADYELTDFRFDGYGLAIRESKVTGQGDLALDWQAMRLGCTDLTLTSSSIAGRGANCELAFDAQGMQLAGDIAFRADVNRVGQWFGVDESSTVHWFGAAEGIAQFTPVPGAIGGALQAKIADLTAARLTTAQGANRRSPWDVLWQEPTVQFKSQFAISPDGDAIQFQRFALESKALQVEGQGTIADVSRSVRLDLTGNWAPNWEAISAIVQGYVGKQVEFQGEPRSESFRVQGPLFADANAPSALISPQLTAETSASWTGGKLLGLPVGPATVRAELKNSVLGFNDPQIQVGPGIVHFNPLVDLRGDPQLIFPRGTILETVELTPDICRGWLKFVAPLLAETTRARGRFSLVADGFQFPVSQPLAGRGSGQLIIEEANVEPGPLGQQFIQLVNTLKQLSEGKALDALFNPAAANARSDSQFAWLQLPAQTINFQLDQQQFVHEGMKLSVGGIPITTRGGIGVDGSLQMVADIPILESWIQKQPALAGFKGTSLQIPIGGTLTQPRLDYRGLTQLTGQVFQKAAGGQIESRLNGLLNEAWQKNVPQSTPSANGIPAQPAATSSAVPANGDSLQKSVENNLIQGLDRLLGPKK